MRLAFSIRYPNFFLPALAYTPANATTTTTTTTTATVITGRLASYCSHSPRRERCAPRREWGQPPPAWPLHRCGTSGLACHYAVTNAITAKDDRDTRAQAVGSTAGCSIQDTLGTSQCCRSYLRAALILDWVKYTLIGFRVVTSRKR